MFTRDDESYLVRAINRNQVVLFLGAGFSLDAKNSLGKPLPTGAVLASAFWSLLGYGGTYDERTGLSELYEAALRSGKPSHAIRQLLESQLVAKEVPESYSAITRVFWNRIYTTNIDDVVEQAYRQIEMPHLDVISYPDDNIPDRDQTLQKLQLIHLHGRLPCAPSHITFGLTQYAGRAGSHDHLYDQFVRDYATKTTIFIGTALDEPLLWQYIELRKGRPRDIGERRPKSFLITPTISPPKRTILESLNIEPVVATTQDFLSWLNGLGPRIVSRANILRETFPDYLEIAEYGDESPRRRQALADFAKVFHAIPTELSSANADRSLFLLGATPRWEDIFANRDAPRTITQRLVATIEERLHHGLNRPCVIPLLGSAGSGKSTVLRRLALTLVQAGHGTYLTNSEEIPSIDPLVRAIDILNRPLVLLFDNAENVLRAIGVLAREFRTLSKPPLLVVAARPNEWDRIIGRLEDGIDVEEFQMPPLDRTEIRAVLATLEGANLLGALKGLSQDARISEFESRARRQLLVAMREATSGRGFDEILNDEFQRLTPDEAKILYLCVALATEAGHRITVGDFVGCSQADPATALSLLDRNLRDIVVRTGLDGRLLLLRHRAIAEFMVDKSAPRALLREAYLRLLGVLASEIGGKTRFSRTFVLYRALVNHRSIVRRFANNANDARSVYDSLLPSFRDSPQFLLQYGSLEMEVGHLDLAENFLNQADALDPGNVYIRNARGLLLLKRSLAAATKPEAFVLRNDGSDLLLETMTNPEVEDAYCFHIYGTQRLQWIRKWAETDDERRNELEHLREIIGRAMRKYSRDPKIVDIKNDVDRDYYSLAIRR